MSTDDVRSGLILRVLWLDEEMIELGCSLAYGKFCGESTCYTTSPQLHYFADVLGRFALTAEGQPMFESALSDGSKACDLRAYRIDKAGHMAVHVKMATDKLAVRPQSVARLELEMLVEAWSLSQFAEQLQQVARTKTGRAFLQSST